MKKIIILILMIVAFPMSVLADHGAPEIQPYKATIDDVNGVVCNRGYHNENNEYVSEDYILKYGDVVTVMSETDISGKRNSYIQYNDEVSCEVLTAQIKPILDTYKVTEHLDEVQKAEKETEIKVINKDGISIYSGPSYGYKVVGKIPFNTDLKYLYSSGGHITDLWLYVNYDDVEGWITTFGNDVAYKSDESMITPHEVSIYDSNNLDTRKEVGKIPAFVIISNFYSLPTVSGRDLYLDYNGIKGFIYLPRVQKLEGMKSITTIYSLDLTKEASLFADATVISKIPTGTTLNFEYFINEGYGFYSLFVEYNGEKGWVYTHNADVDYDLNGKFNSSINELLGDYIEIEPPVEGPETEDEPEADKEPVKNDKDKNKGLTGREIVIICVFGAVVIAVTAVVTIILVNKKKKKNNEIKIEEKENIIEAAKDEVEEEVNKVEENIEEEKPVTKKGKRKTKEK